jgi:hypothetical protein
LNSLAACPGRAIAIDHPRDASEGRGVAQAYEVLADLAHPQGNAGEALALAERALTIRRAGVEPAQAGVR